MKATFHGGINIAIKVPKFKYDETVAFYESKLGLKAVPRNDQATPSVAFEFGPNTLWIDCMENYSQTDVWLEIVTDNLKSALESGGFPLRNEVEPLPSGLNAVWISNPAGVIHLLREEAGAA